MNRISAQLISILIIIQLAACGGGGGDGGNGGNPPTPNQPPIANAGSDQTVIESSTVSLSGSGTDSDGTVVSYRWTQTSGTDVTLSDLNTAMSSFIAPDVTDNETITFSFEVTDNDGATTADIINIIVEPADTTPPVITLNGASFISLTQGDTYVEEGATAIDDRDGPVTVNIIGTIDTNNIGGYTIIYNATDSSNNTSTITRLVYVVADSPDQTPPGIVVNGAYSITLAQGDTYVEEGATAIDDHDGPVSVTITGTVDTNVVGVYTITYTATDSSNNTSSTSRTVNVVSSPDTTPPVITLNGAISITLTQDDPYIEEGATAIDDRDGTVDVTISGTVDNNTVGDYSITYTATDSSNNTSSTSRTVNVVSSPDITPPVITLYGDSSITLTQGDPYIEEGATATDNRDGTVDVIISGTVDNNTVGDYSVTYTASDAANNTSSITRTITVIAQASRPFITTWKTDNQGVTTDFQIEIYTSGTGYNYQVEWGDGSISSNVTGNIIHTYAAAGTYTVAISGEYPQIRVNDKYKLLSVEQWGDISWRTMNFAFYACVNLEINASDNPDLSQVTDMSSMFREASLLNQDISSWDVTTVTNMSKMFEDSISFNQDISSWDVSAVTNMSDMFSRAIAFNQDISSWDVSAVTNMNQMFRETNNFNQDISSWDVSSVISFYRMFFYATAFNQSLNGWELSAVSNMSEMFSSALNFNQSLNDWDVSTVMNMSKMFVNAVAFNGDISEWNVSAVTNMESMFAGATAFNQDIDNWDISSVTAIQGIFYAASAFNQNISSWDVSAIDDMNDVFSEASSFNQDISNWNVSSVNSFYRMFEGAVAFNQDISSWNVSAATDMRSMFFNARAFNKDISSWDVSGVTTMGGMFNGASAFNQSLNSWNVSGVDDMGEMFYDATAFNSDISGWNVSSVTTMFYMFMNASAFNQDISSWDVSAVEDMSEMFDNATAFNQNLSNWDVSAVYDMWGMFSNVTLSTANYDALLIGWSAQNLKSNVDFDAGNSKYSASSQSYRDILTNAPINWVITDGGVVQ